MKGYRFTTFEDSLFIKLLLAIVLLFVAYQLAILCVYGIRPFQFIIASAFFIVILSYFFWKRAVLLILLWVILSGAVRKWLLPEISDIIYFYGHAILSGVYLRYFRERLLIRSELFIKHPINGFLLIFVIYGLVCVINPNLSNVAVGLLGFMVYFYFIPLAYIIPYVFDTKEMLIKYLKIFVSISLPFLILGVVQYFSPLDHPINSYVYETDIYDIALSGSRPRVTSTFSFVSGFPVYLNVLILTLLYLLSIRNNSFIFTLYLYVLIVLSALCLLMTGARGPTTYTLIGSVLFLVLGGVVNIQLIKKSIFKIILVGLLIFLFFQFTFVGQSALESFTTRVTSSSDIIPRLRHTYLAPFQFFKFAGFYGFGIGTTYQGSVALGHNPMELLEVVPGGFEEEQGRVMLEIGVFGYILVYLIRILLIKFFWDLSKRLSDPTLKLFCLSCLLFQVPFALGVANLIFDHTTNVFYWYIIGFLFLLPKLDSEKLSYVKKEKE